MPVGWILAGAAVALPVALTSCGTRTMGRMRIRAYGDRDVPAVVAFYRAAASLDATLQAVTEKGWRGFVGMSFNRGGRNFLVAEDGPVVVAVATSALLPQGRHFRILVHPLHRRRGLGAELLRRIEAQASDAHAPMQCNCRGRWEAGAAFLKKRGFAPVLHLLDMKRDGPPPESEPLPDGFSLRPYGETADDDRAWRRLSELGYRDAPDYIEMTAADLVVHRAVPHFHLWFVEHDGEIVGLCHTKDSQGEQGCVNSVVVDPRARGRGLGLALTVAGLNTLWEQEQRPVTLSVFADNAPAVAIYRGLGFETTDEMVTWRK